MDDACDQSKVAYGSKPDAEGKTRSLHDGNQQFGKVNKMPQESHVRHKEHR